MKSFLIPFTLAVVVNARPEAGLGYNYQKPQVDINQGNQVHSQSLQHSFSQPQSLSQTILQPQQPIFQALPQSQLQLSEQSLSQSQSFFPVQAQNLQQFSQQPQLQVQNIQQISPQSNELFQPSGNLPFSNGANFQSSSLPNNFQSSSLPLNSGPASFQSSSLPLNTGPASFQSLSLPSSNGPSLSAPQPQLVSNIHHDLPTVTKHIYFHLAPEEPELPPPRVLPAPAPQRHYKIIFIKAPSTGRSHQVVQHIPAPAPVEEKTLVYVLVGKPQPQEIVIPQPVPTQPSKPEVYFIKYKANSGVEAGVPLGSTSGASLVPAGQPSLPIVEDLRKNVQGDPISSGESSSSLFSGGLPGESNGLSTKYGPPGYQK